MFTELENAETVIQQLVQIYLVDETTLRHDVTKFVEELVKEELLNCENEILERNLVTIDKIKELLQSKLLDNRLPYKPPTLRKHGKVNQATESMFVDFASWDGIWDVADIS